MYFQHNDSILSYSSYLNLYLRKVLENKAYCIPRSPARILFLAVASGRERDADACSTEFG